jgi:hypothetical protein
MDPDQTAQMCRLHGLDPCWSQTYYVGFVVTRLNYCGYADANVSSRRFLLEKSGFLYLIIVI